VSAQLELSEPTPRTVLNNQQSCRAQADGPINPQNKIALRLFEIARALVRFDHVANRIANANHDIV
jgi:hypothetical protein